MNITIVIPVYNGEETLKSCLDSVTTMEIPDNCKVDILVVNDGSTDKTKEIAQEYQGIRIIDLKQNQGRIINPEQCIQYCQQGDISSGTRCTRPDSIP